MSYTAEIFDNVTPALRGVAADLSDLRPAWRPVSDELYAITQRQITSRGRGKSGRWRDHADATKERIASLNRRGFRVLGELGRATDKMFLSLTRRGAPGGVYEERPDSLTSGTVVRSTRGFPYPQAFHGGTKNQPARPIYDLTDADAARLMRILKRALVKKVEDRGFDYKEDGGEIPF